MATKKRVKKKPAPDRRSTTAEDFSKKFLAAATKNGWKAAICYIVPGEKRQSDGGLRIMGGCGGDAETLKPLAIYIGGKIASKVQEVEKFKK